MRHTAYGVGLAAVALAIAFPATAAADRAWRDVEWSAHPGAGVAAAIGLAALGLLALVGHGCAIAVLGAVFPAVQAAADRRARALGAGWPFVVGSLVLVGVLLAFGAAAGTRTPAVVGATVLLVGLPTFLLALLGALAGMPLLGERMLGARGPAASPLARCIVASLALGLAALPGVLLPALLPITVLAVLAAVGWPLGLGLATVMRRGEGRKAPPPTA